MNIKSYMVMLGEFKIKLALVASVAALAGFASGGGLCDRGRSYWDRERASCIPCTPCDPLHSAVKRPCDLNGNTVCQPLHEIRLRLFPENEASELSEYDDQYYDYTDSGEVSGEGDVKWDAQTATLALAAVGCVVFFVVVLYLTFQHSKQWKALKQALRSDVQDLSAKLKLMEAGDAPAEPAAPASHIYCNIQVAKDSILGPSSDKKGLGNVYTQEKHSS